MVVAAEGPGAESNFDAGPILVGTNVRSGGHYAGVRPTESTRRAPTSGVVLLFPKSTGIRGRRERQGN